MPTLPNGKTAVTISVSPWSALSLVGIVLALAALYQLRDVVALLFVAMIFASALHGWVQWLVRRKIPKVAAVFIIYIGLFLVISGVFALLVPPLAEEVRSLTSNFPNAFQQFTSSFSAAKDFINEAGVANEIVAWLQSLSSVITQGGGPVDAITGFFGSIISVFVVLITTFYMIVQDDAIKTALHSIIPDRYSERVSTVINNVQTSVGLWLRAQLLLMGIIALAAYIGLSLLGVHNALALALFAGLTEAIPTLGPIIGSIPAIFFALVQSPVKAVFVLILYVAIQQLENNIIVPQLMRRAIGINPLVSLIALLVGAKLAGIVGAVLAIPVVTSLMVVVDDVFNSRTTPSTAAKQSV